MSIFRRKKIEPKDPKDLLPDPARKELEETKILIDHQKEESDKVVTYVKEVLKEKDRLLADAVNQTGRALRQQRQGRRNLRGQE